MREVGCFAFVLKGYTSSEKSRIEEREMRPYRLLTVAVLARQEECICVRAFVCVVCVGVCVCVCAWVIMCFLCVCVSAYVKHTRFFGMMSLAQH